MSDQLPATRGANWPLRLGIGLAAVVVLLACYLIGVAVIPRWWAQWLGNRIDGHLFRGGGLGLLFGFLFTVLAVSIVRQAVRRGLGWRARVALVVGALLVAAPNLMTLGIVLGTGNAAHAGERILDVDGPGFRAGSLIGALVAVGIAVAWVTWTWRVDRLDARSRR